MHMRKSDLFLISLVFACILVAVTFVDAHWRVLNAGSHLDGMAQMVRQLELTDLSLFTEARYTRHLSQADYHTAFQDHPLAIEHFPSGSLIHPPQLLQGTDEVIFPETALPD